MICVLCEDSELTKANFQHMIRCDCKGYWKSRVCAHTLAIAHWYGEEFGLVDVESLNKEDQSRVRVRVNACHYN